MDKLKVCFVGIGSIAKRHIANLHQVCDERGVEIQIDAFRRKLETAEGVTNVYNDINEVPSGYDCIFITNPTEQHLNTLKIFHNKGKHFFIEKPLVSLSQIEDAQKFNLKDDSIYYVACPLRYCSVIKFIKENISPDDVISIRSISSSYLPEWRPGTDYRKTYSAHREMGGGVSIDLIHEWDYLTYLFGWPTKVICLTGKKSELEIDSDDYAIYLAELEDKIIELHLDYFGRKNIREIQLFTKTDTIIGNINDESIHFLNTQTKIDFGEERNDFQKREITHFLDLISGKVNRTDSFLHGIKLLHLTQGRLMNE